MVFVECFFVLEQTHPPLVQRRFQARLAGRGTGRAYRGSVCKCGNNGTAGVSIPYRRRPVPLAKTAGPRKLTVRIGVSTRECWPTPIFCWKDVSLDENARTLLSHFQCLQVLTVKSPVDHRAFHRIADAPLPRNLGPPASSAPCDTHVGI